MVARIMFRVTLWLIAWSFMYWPTVLLLQIEPAVSLSQWATIFIAGTIYIVGSAFLLKDKP